MAILITGGTGFIGQALCHSLLDPSAHSLIILSRKKRLSTPGKRFIQSLDEIKPRDSITALINLAGENIAQKPWTTRRKKKIWNSRINITQELIDVCQRLAVKPKCFISVSAVGFYGPQEDHILTEASTPMPCFSHSLCKAWEEAALKAQTRFNIPTYILRLGVVLAENGGVFAKFSPLFKGFFYPKFSRKIFFPWVSRKDVVALIDAILTQKILAPGIINVVAPDTIDYNSFFTHCKSVLKLRVPLPVPVGLFKFLTGDLGKEILFGSYRVIPAELNKCGYCFQHPTVMAFLKDNNT
jgi:uncharacterized protein (TIGR01777 family)